MLYAIGRIVLFAPRGSPLVVDEQMTGLARAAGEGQPESALRSPTLSMHRMAARPRRRSAPVVCGTSCSPHLVLGENISQTAQFATAGGAAGGIIAYSLVLAPALKGRGTYTLIPESLHPPLRQRMVLLKRAGPAAQRFYEYLQRPAARALLAQYGFALPN